MREGGQPTDVWLVKEGSFRVSKFVLARKNITPEVDLLKKCCLATIRCNQNLSKRIGLKKDSQIQMRLIGPGIMIGDYECIQNVPY